LTLTYENMGEVRGMIFQHYYHLCVIKNTGVTVNVTRSKLSSVY